MKAAPRAVTDIKRSRNRTDFLLDDGLHFYFRDGSFFCWLMMGDVVTIRGGIPAGARGEAAASGSKFKRTSLRFCRVEEMNATLLSTPPVVESGSNDDVLFGYLEDACVRHSPDATNTIFRALKTSLGEARRAEWYGQICEWSQGKGWEETCLPLLNDKSVLDAKGAEVALGRLFRRWYRRQTLRRLYNLQLTKRELRGSFLRAFECYEICRRNPFLVSSISADKARQICVQLGIPVSRSMLAMGEALRCLKGQFDGFHHLAIREDRLAEACATYGGVSEALIREDAVVVMETQQPLVCLCGLYRVMDRVAACLRDAPLSPISGFGVEHWNDESLTREQKYAVAYALLRPVAPIVGRAGTGKTKVIAEIAFQAQTLLRRTWRVAVFTGKATSRVKEELKKAGVPFDESSVTTIHRLIYRKTAPCQLLIFDESSMISTFLFDQLLTSNPWVRSAQLVFSGDPNQLSPIGPGYLFHQLLRSKEIPSFVLTKNFRAQGPNAGVADFSEWVLEAKTKPTPYGRYSCVEIMNGGLGHAKKLLCELLSSDFSEEETSAAPAERQNETKLLCLSDTAHNANEPGPAKESGVAYRVEEPGAAYRVEEPDDTSLVKKFEGSCRVEEPGSTRDPGVAYHVEEPDDSRPAEESDGTPFPKRERPAYTPADFKVICPYRRETAVLCEYLRELFGFGCAGIACPGTDRVFAVGERVVMTFNDYKNNIYNGEEGVVVSIKTRGDIRESLLTVNFNLDDKPFSDPAYLEGAQKEAARGSKVVEFFDIPARKKASDDEDDFISIEDDDDALPEEARGKASIHELEYAYALTVHKAQGSEWDNVFFVIPDGYASKLLTNELFYTAITRTRKSLWVVAPHQLIMKAVRTPLAPVTDPTHILMCPT